MYIRVHERIECVYMSDASVYLCVHERCKRMYGCTRAMQAYICTYVYVRVCTRAERVYICMGIYMCVCIFVHTLASLVCV